MCQAREKTWGNPIIFTLFWAPNDVELPIVTIVSMILGEATNHHFYSSESRFFKGRLYSPWRAHGWCCNMAPGKTAAVLDRGQRARAQLLLGKAWRGEISGDGWRHGNQGFFQRPHPGENLPFDARRSLLVKTTPAHRWWYGRWSNMLFIPYRILHV